MIKGELDMDKKELTIEELEAQYKALGEQLTKRKKEEEDRKQAKLALEKDSRHKEIEEVAKHYCELVKAYQKDYGCYYYCATETNSTHGNTDFDIMSRLWNTIFGV